MKGIACIGNGDNLACYCLHHQLVSFCLVSYLSQAAALTGSAMPSVST